MKRLKKYILGLVITNFVCGAGFVGYVTANVVVPSFKGTNISFKDLFKKNLDPVKYKKLNANLNRISETSGNRIGKSIMKSIKAILPDPKFDYSTIKGSKYNYESIDTVIEMSNKKADEGLELGLKYLKDSEKMNSKVRNKTLRN